MNGSLKGKTFFVTGAAMGIGKAIALATSQEGARVIIADIDEEKSEETASLIRDRGGEADAIMADVADYRAVENAAALLRQKGITPDVLVNNAAVFTIKPFLETGPDDWDRDLDVCLKSVLNCCRAFLPAMIERGSGSIVNIASDAGRVGEKSWSVYSAAKGGVIAFTKSLAQEVGPQGIRVNAVSPGTTMTEKVKAFIPADRLEKMKKAYPLGRLAEPEDIAKAVVFLASDRASFITGQVISVSGGYSMAG
jgi:2-hydroxycyclohexanecarboxyl-CoA dehydrogenase